MRKKNSIWFLKSILKQFNEASNSFKDYLNSNNKDFWDVYNIKSLGWISFLQLIDKKLMPSSFYPKLKELSEYAEKQYQYSEYTSYKHNKKDAIKTLEILENLKKDTQNLLNLEIKRLNLEDISLKED